MSKISRIICCLILPVIAMFCFSGCEKDRTKADISNKLSSIRATYVVDETQNEFFDEDGLLTINYLNSEIRKIYSASELNRDQFSTDLNLYRRYYALIKLQHSVLNTSLLYYLNMSENFFDKSEVAKVKTHEFNEIYKRLASLEDALKEFKVAKDKLEQTVEVLTFKGVVRADLTSYSYELNKLIEEALEFGNYFIQLNDKYLFNIEVTDSNKISYVKHYIFEAAHKITEVSYYKYLKAFNNVNECDLSGLLDSPVFSQDEILQNYFSDDVSLSEQYKAMADDLNPDVEVKDIEGFQEIRDGFLQKLQIYKVVFSNMDYYTYNYNFIQGEEKLSKYMDSISSVERANINLIEKFYETSFASYNNDSFWSEIQL